MGDRLLLQVPLLVHLPAVGELFDVLLLEAQIEVNLAHAVPLDPIASEIKACIAIVLAELQRAFRVDFVPILLHDHGEVHVLALLAVDPAPILLMDTADRHSIELALPPLQAVSPSRSIVIQRCILCLHDGVRLGLLPDASKEN